MGVCSICIIYTLGTDLALGSGTLLWHVHVISMEICAHFKTAMTGQRQFKLEIHGREYINMWFPIEIYDIQILHDRSKYCYIHMYTHVDRVFDKDLSGNWVKTTHAMLGHFAKLPDSYPYLHRIVACSCGHLRLYH